MKQDTREEIISIGKVVADVVKQARREALDSTPSDRTKLDRMIIAAEGSSAELMSLLHSMNGEPQRVTHPQLIMLHNRVTEVIRDAQETVERRASGEAIPIEKIGEVTEHQMQSYGDLFHARLAARSLILHLSRVFDAARKMGDSVPASSTPGGNVHPFGPRNG